MKIKPPLTHKLTPQEAALKAVSIFGTQKKFAEQCGVCQQTISKWLRTGVPIKKVPLVEKAAKGFLTRHDLRPDFFNI